MSNPSLLRRLVIPRCPLPLVAVLIFLGSNWGLQAQVPGGFDPAYQPPVLDQGAQAVAIQPVVVNGQTVYDTLLGGSFTTYNGAAVSPLIRLNANGAKDDSFASSAGILVPREDADVNALLVQPDGNIIAAAYGTTTAAATLTRLKADGILDTSFSTNLPDGGVMAMAIQPVDGENRIVIAGNFYTVDGIAVTGLTRLKSDGTIDSSFAPAPAPTDASGTYLIQQGSAVLVQPDGKIVVAGSINTTNGVVYALLRLNSDGSQDTAFAPVFPNSGGSFQALGLQTDGQIVAAGNVLSIGGVTVQNVARFSGTDGTLDQSFVPDVPFDAGFNQLVVQTDGKILVSNNVGGGVTLARLNANGTLDRDYSPGFVLDQSTVTALALQPDGLGVVSGTLIPSVPATNEPNISVARLLASTAIGATTLNLTVPGTAKVWLAPNGAVDQQGEGDNLTNAEPTRATGLALTPGATLTFSATGSVDNIDRGGGQGAGPDGDGNIEPEYTQDGLSGVTATGDGLLGVFIGDSAADLTNANAPASLDFSGSTGGVPGGQDYTTLSPLLNQVFFIGDGKTSGGVTQQVTVPAGATHLAFGTVDYGIWLDNVGGFNVTVKANAAASATPLTATTLALAGANLGAAVAKGTPLTFTATQGATGTLSVRVQSSLTPTVESSWTDLPDTTNGGAGFLAPKSDGTYVLTTTHYPSGNVSFRAITASAGQTDAISNVLQSYAIDIALLAVSPDDLTYTVAGQGVTNQVVPDDKITYSLTVHNFGFEPATGVVVQVTFDPANTKLVTKKVSDGGTVAGSVLTWNLPTLASGDHHTFTFSVKVNADVDLNAGKHTGVAVNSAGSNGGHVYIDAEQIPPIQLLIVPPFNISAFNNGQVKDSTGAYVAGAGKPLIFTFTVHNRTAGTVSNVNAYIPLPSGYLPANFKNARLINADGSPTKLFDANGNPIATVFKLGAAINGGIDQNAVLVTIPSIAAGQFQEFTITVNVPYSAAPGSDVTLPLVQLTGTAYDGAPLAYAEQGYQAQISNAPPAALPNLVLEKIVPTAAEIQTAQYLALKVTPAGQTPSPLTAAANELFNALSSATGITAPILEATPAGLLQSGYTPPGHAFVPGLNPYVSRDNDPDTGASRYEVPSPTSIYVPVPYVTYLLVYFNSGGGAAAGITISDAVPPGLRVDPASIVIKGSALVDSTGVIGGDGRSLTFSLGQVKPGTGGAILYHALVYAPGAGGPQTGTTLPPVSTSLTTASLSNQVFFTPAESLLVTGKADASVSATESDPGDGTAIYNILYRNTGGQTSKDFVVVSDVPDNSTFVSAQFLNVNQYPTDPEAGQLIHDPLHENTGGKVIFELGRVVQHAFGFVQVVYKLNDLTPVPQAVPGLIHHYYVDGSTFPGTPILPSIRGERPEPRGIETGPRPRFGFGDLLGAIKTGLDNIGHAIGGFFSKLTGGGGPTTAPTLWVSRVVPLAVQEDTDFTYFITIGNCGNTDAYRTSFQMYCPTGATFKSASDGRYAANIFSFDANGHDSNLPAHQSKTVTVTFHATASAGSTMDSRLCYYEGYADDAYDYGTGPILTTKASSYVYSAAQLAIFDTIKGSIIDNAALASGIDPISISAGAGYTAHLAALTPSSTTTSVAHADYVALTNGATIVPQGGGNIVALGGSNIVAQGGGNIVAQGGGNIVVQGGGNIVINGVSGFGGPTAVSNILSVQGLGVLAQGGGNIVTQGGGNIVAQGGGNIIDFQTGNSLIATSSLPFKLIDPAGPGNAFSTGLIGEDGSSLIGEDGSSLIGEDGSSLIGEDGSSLISQDGGGLTSQSGGGLFGTGGAALQVSGHEGTAQRFGAPIRRTVGPALTLGSTTGSFHADFNNAGSLVIGVGGSQPVAP